MVAIALPDWVVVTAPTDPSPYPFRQAVEPSGLPSILCAEATDFRDSPNDQFLQAIARARFVGTVTESVPLSPSVLARGATRAIPGIGFAASQSIVAEPLRSGKAAVGIAELNCGLALSRHAHDCIRGR